MSYLLSRLAATLTAGNELCLLNNLSILRRGISDPASWSITDSRVNRIRASLLADTLQVKVNPSNLEGSTM